MSQPPAYLLSHRGVLRVTGADSRSFLQGLLSNDMNACTQQRPLYAALLTPQGKFLHDVFVHDTAIAVQELASRGQPFLQEQRPAYAASQFLSCDNNISDGFLLDAQAARLDDLLARLTRYKLRAAVTLENVSDAYDVIALFDNGERCADPRLPALGSRFIAPKNTMSEASPNADAYDQQRLALGIPEGGLDIIPETSTLAEANLDLLNAISWTKGCYVGQELTARMKYRGLVKKRLFPVTLTGDPPDFDMPVFAGTDEIGLMRSTHGTFGLALLKIDAAQTAIATQTPLICGATTLMPHKPEWMQI